MAMSNVLAFGQWGYHDLIEDLGRYGGAEEKKPTPPSDGAPHRVRARRPRRRRPRVCRAPRRGTAVQGSYGGRGLCSSDGLSGRLLDHLASIRVSLSRRQ